MFKKILAICALLFNVFCIAQNAQTSFEYQEATKAFVNKDYVLADSLYTVTLRYRPNADTYFKRAMTRQKLNRQKGYDEDLVFAAAMGDNESYTLLKKDFEKADTLRITIKIVNVDSTELGFYHVSYSTSKTKEVLDAKFNDQNKILNVTWYTPLAQIDTIAEEPAEFTGGLKALMKYISMNVRYPSYAREKGISGKAYLKFEVTQTGAIDRVVLLKGVEDCKECDEEAMRVVAGMPRWMPARLNGRLVKTYFTLPFSFKVQR